MEQLRVFIAVDLPSSLQGRLGSVAERLHGLPGDARWVSAAHLHLTLRFLGELEPASVELVKETVGRVASRHRPFSLALGGLGLFPERGAPNVVWVGVDAGRAELMALQRDLERELELSGFPPEDRPFTPHLTLARLRGAEPGAWREAAGRFGKDPLLSFVVREVRVMRSDLTRRGPIYSTLAVAPLGVAAPASGDKRGE
ncbi:MAG TPA: RNA 2',3'-cyclic phosphodiesterase [Firmicutes bacterium]|nr:RNA 2',3'-cyclic phosphodiesterase [Bacillota bacterium]